jgi:hypothetical protein
MVEENFDSQIPIFGFAVRALCGGRSSSSRCDAGFAPRAYAPDYALHSDADATKSERLEVLVQFGLGDSFPVV